MPEWTSVQVVGEDDTIMFIRLGARYEDDEDRANKIVLEASPPGVSVSYNAGDTEFFPMHRVWQLGRND